MAATGGDRCVTALSLPPGLCHDAMLVSFSRIAGDARNARNLPRQRWYRIVTPSSLRSGFHVLLLGLALAMLGAPATAQGGDDPRAIVRAATRAVEGDSA